MQRDRSGAVPERVVDQDVDHLTGEPSRAEHGRRLRRRDRSEMWRLTAVVARLPLVDVVAARASRRSNSPRSLVDRLRAAASSSSIVALSWSVCRGLVCASADTARVGVHRQDLQPHRDPGDAGAELVGRVGREVPLVGEHRVHPHRRSVSRTMPMRSISGMWVRVNGREREVTLADRVRHDATSRSSGRASWRACTAARPPRRGSRRARAAAGSGAATGSCRRAGRPRSRPSTRMPPVVTASASCVVDAESGSYQSVSPSGADTSSPPDAPSSSSSGS